MVTHRPGVVNLSHIESLSQGWNSTVIFDEPACWSQGLAGLMSMIMHGALARYKQYYGIIMGHDGPMRQILLDI